MTEDAEKQSGRLWEDDAERNYNRPALERQTNPRKTRREATSPTAQGREKPPAEVR